MIRRPLHPRFTQAVLAGEKFTTIRDGQWPVGKPIMLYNWSGAPYRSKQVDVAQITVTGFWPIQITHDHGGGMYYEHGMESQLPLWQTEGFTSRDDLDAWFRPMIKPGCTVSKTLMRFALRNTK
jgi:hypothetical protein